MKSDKADVPTPSAAQLETRIGEGRRASLAVCPYGGQVLSWIVDGSERLFVSPQAQFVAGKAIRGGIPVIFPQFGTRGSGPRHGFARLRQWSMEPAKAGAVQAVLREDAASLDLWPHAFEARLTARLADENSLQVRLAITNTGDTPFAFTAALHTYLRVADISLASLRGLRDSPFLDATRGDRRFVQEAELLTFPGEIDRVYVGTAERELVLADRHRDLRIRQRGFADTVVWNPGEALAASLPDLGPGGHLHFLCVEAACVESPVELAPDGSWHGEQTLIG